MNRLARAILQLPRSWREACRTSLVQEERGSPRRPSPIRLTCSLDLKQLRQSRKIEGHLARFVEREDAGMLCRAWVCPAVKYAKPIAFGILDRVTAWQF